MEDKYTMLYPKLKKWNKIVKIALIFCHMGAVER